MRPQPTGGLPVYWYEVVSDPRQEGWSGIRVRELVAHIMSDERESVAIVLAQVVMVTQHVGPWSLPVNTRQHHVIPIGSGVRVDVVTRQCIPCKYRVVGNVEGRIYVK